MPEDFPLPIAGEVDEPAVDAWQAPQQPTTLIALWPGDEAPTATEVISRLAQATGAPPQQLEELHNDQLLWNGVYQTAISEVPLIIWAEMAKPLSPDELDDPAAHACKWAIGIETMLPVDSSLEHYGNLLRALSIITDAPAILDTVTWRYFRSRELQDLAADPPAELSADALWTIHAVNDPAGRRASGAWIHTHGLLRCGVPELEMLEVPPQHVNAAAGLVNAVAEFLLDQGIVPPHEPFEVGQDIALTLHPWSEIVPDMPPDAMGSLRDRQGDDNPHAGSSAVLCGPHKRGAFRQLWTWPVEAVERLSGDDAVLFRSTASTQRQAKLAQQYWAELAIAHATLRQRPTKDQPPPIVLVKAGMPTDDSDPDHREHLWFKVNQFEKDQALGELLNQPIAISNMKAGAIVRVQRGWLSDWAVMTPAGRFGPGDIPAMWRAIHAMTGAAP